MPFTTPNLSVSLHNQHLLTYTRVDLEACALVERLLNELLKTTEAFHQVKNQNAVLTQESLLNS